MGNRHPVRVLFVCMGNICRSPTAEGVLRHLVAREAPDLRVEVDSAGTHDYHIGDPPDRRSQAAARKRGIDLGGLRARQLCAEDFDRFDYVLVMDDRNLADAAAIAPSEYRAEFRRLMEFAPEAGRLDVPDPYYGGPEGFEEVLDLTEVGARGWIAAARRKKPS
jgi:protein-tyrosine phosphatase